MSIKYQYTGKNQQGQSTFKAIDTLENANYELLKRSGVPFRVYGSMRNDDASRPVASNAHWVKKINLADGYVYDPFQLGSGDDFGEFIADRQTLTLERDLPLVFITFSRYEGGGHFGVVSWDWNNGFQSNMKTFTGKHALDHLQVRCKEIFDEWVGKGVAKMTDALDEQVNPKKSKKKNNEMDLLDIE